jgi:hypothetical protein
MSIFSRLARTGMGVTLAAILSACQTLGGVGLVPSMVTTELAPEAADAIAADMVGRFSEQIGPGDNTVVLTPDNSVFGQALMAALQVRGYGIVTDQRTQGSPTVPLAYVVDDFEGSVLVRLSTTTIDMTRMYKPSATGAEPVSPLSVNIREGEGTS